LTAPTPVRKPKTGRSQDKNQRLFRPPEEDEKRESFSVQGGRFWQFLLLHLGFASRATILTVYCMNVSSNAATGSNQVRECSGATPDLFPIVNLPSVWPAPGLTIRSTKKGNEE